MKEKNLLQKCKLICSSTALLLSLTIQANPLPSPSTSVVSTIKPMLNSDRIEYFFGSYGVARLQPDSNKLKKTRIANLYSTHDNQKIMRTLAIVDFVEPMLEPLALAHQKIQNGESIGIALRNDNWSIIKEPIYFGEATLKPNVLQLMFEKNNTKGAIYIYKLSVKNNTHTNPIGYCNIIEIYSPQYLTSVWLKEIYKDDFPQYNTLTPEITEIIKNMSPYIAKL